MATISDLPDEMLEYIFSRLVAGIGALSFVDIESLGRMRLVNRAFSRSINIPALLRSLVVVVTLDNVHEMRSGIRAFVNQGRLAKEVTKLWLHVNLEFDDSRSSDSLFAAHEHLVQETFKDARGMLEVCVGLQNLYLSGRDFDFLFDFPSLDRVQSLHLRFDDSEFPDGLLYAVPSLTTLVVCGTLQAQVDSFWREGLPPALTVETVHLQYLNRFGALHFLQYVPLQPFKLCLTLEHHCGFDATTRILQQELGDHQHFERSFFARLKEVEISTMKMTSEGQSVFVTTLERIFSPRGIKVTWTAGFQDYFPSHLVPEGVPLGVSSLA